MKRPILIVVNGGAESALAKRAEGLFSSFAHDYEVAYSYRKPRRLAAFAHFVGDVVRSKAELVYLLDTAIPGALAVAFCRLFANRRFAVDTGDLGYKLAKSKGGIGLVGLSVIFVAEFLAIRLAEFVVVRGTFHKTLLETTTSQKVFLIRDAAWTAAVSSRPKGNLRTELGLADRFVVGLVGSLNYALRLDMCYGWDVIEALRFLDDDVPVSVVIIGDGDGENRLRSRASALGRSPQVNFLGRVGPEALRTHLQLFDVAISTQTNNDVGMVRTTGKLVEYMAAGCFVVCSDVGEARLLLPDIMRVRYDGVKDDAYPKRLAERLLFLYRNRDIVVAGGRRNREVARELLDYGMASTKLRGLVSSYFSAWTQTAETSG